MTSENDVTIVFSNPKKHKNTLFIFIFHFSFFVLFFFVFVFCALFLCFFSILVFLNAELKLPRHSVSKGGYSIFYWGRVLALLLCGGLSFLCLLVLKGGFISFIFFFITLLLFSPFATHTSLRSYSSHSFQSLFHSFIVSHHHLFQFHHKIYNSFF